MCVINNDNGVRVVSFAKFKNKIFKSTMIHSNIINSLGHFLLESSMRMYHTSTIHSSRNPISQEGSSIQYFHGVWSTLDNNWT
jgi:hypothetical protein